MTLSDYIVLGCAVIILICAVIIAGIWFRDVLKAYKYLHWTFEETMEFDIISDEEE